ncbi:MAG: sigma-70 family RNA polymerase sigma factor [Chitinophagaceae bacterium]
MRYNMQSQTKLYKLFMQPMFLICLRYCNNREEAEDVLQEGFMKVFDFIHQYNHKGPLEGWMRQIMIHCAFRKYRNNRLLHPVVDITTTEIVGTAHEEILSRLGTKELISMIQQLPPAYRMVFNLFVFEKMKHREIADLLGIAEGTSKSNLSAARYILQKAVTFSLQSSKINFK